MTVSDWISSVVFSGVLLAAAFLIVMRGQRVYHRSTYFFFILGMIVVVGIMQLVFKYTDFYIASLFKELCYIFGLNAVQAGIAMGVVLVGVSAFALKEQHPMWFGLLEVIFAAAGAFHVAIGMSPDEPLKNGGWWVLGGCMYIVQEGLSNISDADKKPPVQPAPKPAPVAGGATLS
jgi:hypothetical protein